MTTLIFCIGNNGRQDDGLAWAVAEALEQESAFAGHIHCRYHLQVEDAELLSKADRVVFVDAFKGALPDGFAWEKIGPSAEFEFTTHALSPAAVLYLSKVLYGKTPESAWCLLLEGEKWGFETGLSKRAQDHLNKALASLPGAIPFTRAYPPP